MWSVCSFSIFGYHLLTDYIFVLLPVVFRVCELRTTTPRLLRMIPCWFLTMRAVAPPPALSALSTPPARGTRTMTTSMTGAHASRSWLTCTGEGMMIKPTLSHAHTPLSCQLACHALTLQHMGLLQPS